MTQLLSKRMVLAYAVAAPAVIVDLPNEQASRILQEDSNLACPTSKIAALHYKPTEDRKAQMTLHKIKK